MHTACVKRGRRKCVLRYASGQGAAALDAALDAARSGAGPLRWPDAAALGFQVAQRAANECLAALRPPPPAQDRSRAT